MFPTEALHLIIVLLQNCRHTTERGSDNKRNKDCSHYKRTSKGLDQKKKKWRHINTWDKRRGVEHGSVKMKRKEGRKHNNTARCKKKGQWVFKRWWAGNERLWCRVNTAGLVCTSHWSRVRTVRGVTVSSFTRRHINTGWWFYHVIFYFFYYFSQCFFFKFHLLYFGEQSIPTQAQQVERTWNYPGWLCKWQRCHSPLLQASES